ncbi:unnamed protein product [Discosporangium mesarthrocarpum]
MDFGHCAVLSFHIDLKPGTVPIRQRAYRRGPTFRAKVQVELNKLLAAGFLPHSYPSWANPLSSPSDTFVVAKRNGQIRLTCNYKRVDDSTVIPQLLLPLIDDTLMELGGAMTYLVFDVQSCLSQFTTQEDSIPVTAATIQEGLFD